MTREEFTTEWWELCRDADVWVDINKTPIALSLANKLWWHSDSPNWRLSAHGFKQMRAMPASFGVLQKWPVDALHTPKLTMQLTRLCSPWCVIVNNISRLESIWLWGEIEKVTMALCGGDIDHFLKCCLDNTNV